MHNLDPPEPVPSNPRNGLFHMNASKEVINNYFIMEKIISGQYPNHVIVAYRPGDMILGLVALQADIGVDEQYESGMYFCRFSEAVALATASPRQYINKNLTVGAIMFPLTICNEQFHMQYSVIYSDWDIFKIQ